MKDNIKYGDFLFYHIENADLLTGFVIGHLVLEHLMKKMVSAYDPKLTHYADNLRHAQLITLCFDLNLIDANQKSALSAINKMRNNFAHNLGFNPTPNELKDLFLLAKKGFSDMTDGLAQGIEALNNQKWDPKAPGNEYTLSDLFIQIAYDMDEMIEGLGKDGWLKDSI